MNVITTPAYNEHRFIKFNLEKDEVAMLENDLIIANMPRFRLSYTGMFTLSMIEEHRNKKGSFEVTYGKQGVKELLEDIDYKLRDCTKSHTTKLLICHLQYFLMREGNFANCNVCISY